MIYTLMIQLALNSTKTNSSHPPPPRGILPLLQLPAGWTYTELCHSGEHRRMNIALMVTRADPVGGAQIHVRDLAAAARAHGHSPTVITSGSGPFLQDLRALHIPVVVLRYLAAPISPLQDFRALQEIQATLQSLQPDVLATHSSKAGILGRIVARRLRMPVVFTVHGWSFTPGIAPPRAALYRLIERLAAPLSSKIITVSEFDRRLALEAGIRLDWLWSPGSSRRRITLPCSMPSLV